MAAPAERERNVMNNLEECIGQARSIAVSGHVRPDGDCAGSCLATYNYLKTYHPQIDVDLYLEPIPNIFKFLTRADEIISESDYTKKYDLMIVQDCGDAGRLGAAARLLVNAGYVVCIDHHVSNAGFGDESYIFPNASSTSELIFELLPIERITKQIAECIYVGILHDTGMFQYSCTSSKTMRTAGFLMDTGIDFSWIADKTFMEKTYAQSQILARAIQKSRLHLGGRCISSIITSKDMEDCCALPKHLEGIVPHLRSTKGVEAAIFFYQKDAQEYKISMRSAADVDVAQIAMNYGGGGHIRAAGASTKLPPEECLEQILAQIESQLAFDAHGK